MQTPNFTDSSIRKSLVTLDVSNCCGLEVVIGTRTVKDGKTKEPLYHELQLAK